MSQEHAPVEPGGGTGSLWYALFGGPVAWFIGLAVAYFIVTPSCDAGDELPLHLVSAGALLLAVGATLAGYVRWRGVGGKWPGDGGGRIDRSRFLAAIGTLISMLFALAIIAQWAVTTVHEPCWTRPRLPDRPDAMGAPTPQAPPPRGLPRLRAAEVGHTDLATGTG